MDYPAFCIDNLEITWSTVVVALGVIAAVLLMLGLFPEKHGKRRVVFSLPFALVFSFLLARLIHYYCNAEQYKSLQKAFFDFSTGSFCFTGVVAGCALAVGLTKIICKKSSVALLSALYAIGLCPVLILARLSMIFGNGCRAKLVIKDERYFGLPFSTEVFLEGNSIGHYLALFFWSAAALALVLALSLGFWFINAGKVQKRREYGHSALFTMSVFSAFEIVTDSMRYDKSFLRSNGFVSHAEIFYACILLGIFVFCNIRMVKKNGFRKYYIFIWAAGLICLVGAGVLEYYVQRRGDLFFVLYGCMLILLCGMAALNTVACVLGNRKATDAKPASAGTADEKVPSSGTDKTEKKQTKKKSSGKKKKKRKKKKR